MDDRGLKINQIVIFISISREKVENILRSELDITTVSDRWVSHLPTPDQSALGRSNQGKILYYLRQTQLFSLNFS